MTAIKIERTVHNENLLINLLLLIINKLFNYHTGRSRLLTSIFFKFLSDGVEKQSRDRNAYCGVTYRYKVSVTLQLICSDRCLL